ncbi:MAG: ABC transporter ATP-binding protein, partial [Oscillospiraceae bacterium]|nr:ABC transporter ATP-binding protein [Oscillospiraceae bacterium]
AELTKAIEELTKEKTIIMIAHRLKTVEHADNIIVIDSGKIVEQGRHDELMREEGIYRTFVTDRQKAASWKL